MLKHKYLLTGHVGRLVELPSIDMNMDSKFLFHESFDLKCHVLRKNP